MAKFTIYFKEKILDSYIFDSGVVRIGRDETNDLVIENLSVAPAHAVVIVKDENCLIKQLNEDFPLTVNYEKCKETLLQDNDKISVGKHIIVYHSTESVVVPVQYNDGTDHKDVKNNTAINNTNTKVPDANLQVLDGQHIGRILPLKKSMTRFGQSGSGVVIIARRKEGYFISSLEGDSNAITVNQQPIEDRAINLKNSDIVVIDNTTMQFFLDR